MLIMWLLALLLVSVHAEFRRIPTTELEEMTHAVRLYYMMSTALKARRLSGKVSQSGNGFAGDNGQMTIFYREQDTTDAGSGSVDVSSAANVAELRESIAAAAGRDKNTFQIRFAGVQLDDTDLLADSGINPEATVDINRVPTTIELLVRKEKEDADWKKITVPLASTASQFMLNARKEIEVVIEDGYYAGLLFVGGYGSFGDRMKDNGMHIDQGWDHNLEPDESEESSSDGSYIDSPYEPKMWIKVKFQ